LSANSAFGRYIVTLPISRIVPQREPTAIVKKSACFKQIESSLEHIGLIEPLVVFEQKDGTFLIVDGNTRFFILKSQGASDVACIVAADDEAYTYNKRVSHVSPIAQHFMLLRVLENGVSEERVAAALNLDVRAVHRKRDLLKGICPEAVSLLEGRRLSERAFATLRKMKPLRQIESAEHMIAANNFATSFLRSILLITKPEMLMENSATKGGHGKKLPQRSLLESEHEGLLKNLKTVEGSLGLDMLTLAVALKYLERILRNQKAKWYLEQKHPETYALLAGLIRDSDSAEEHAA
jgi:hypothetical protein